MRKETRMKYDKFLLFASIVEFAAALYFMALAFIEGDMLYSAQGTVNLAIGLFFYEVWAD